MSVERIARVVWAGGLATLVTLVALVGVAPLRGDAEAAPRECPAATSPGGGGSASPVAAPPGADAIGLGPDRISCPQELPGLGNFAEVDPGRLYRSAQPTREGLQLARSRFGVRTVISFRSLHSDRGDAEAIGLQYHRIPFSAWHVTPDDAVRFLRLATDARNYPILVHCQHGADRTGTMVAVYRIFVQGWKTEDAIAELPRFGFHTIWANLKTFLRDEEWRRAAEAVRIPRDGLP
jgi:protein tyrosine phosphatase (PTP) superfamily phosphohydrolase (DUF442 family)